MSAPVAFDTVLVANRGEIARRVLAAARRRGLRTVAVYSDADRGSPHVAEADVALRIGPPPPTESYLSIPALLDAARRSGASAVHPGYGFLAESAAFARACEAAGLCFVGPPASVIEAMSRKDEARRIARAAGVPVVPAAEGSDLHTLARRVEQDVGYPALVKAVAGGGGKGMRIVRQPEELEEALARCGREAAAAFGDGSVFVERYVEHGRHVEVQVLADRYGHVIHVLDRDCSVQRRHQKVVEEAPASTVPLATRQAAWEAAVRLAAHVGYENAGTVEFLVAGEEFFFLEMNTRLQVEHAVTELVTGLDLVDLQLALAAGEPLRLAQEDVVAHGHAIEARVYAEDPARDFLPQAGTPTLVRFPASVRVETALVAGEPVGTSYDPMLAKLVAHGPTREAARQRLVGALDDAAVFGLTTNLGFLRRLVASPAFQAAEIDTGWLDRRAGELAPPSEAPAVAAAFVLATETRAARSGPFALDGWRLAGPSAPTRVELRSGADRRELVVHADGRVVEGGRVTTVALVRRDGDLRLLELDGVLERFVVALEPEAVTVSHRGEVHRFERAERRVRDGGSEQGDGVVLAPLPGVVTSVAVAVGEEVAAGALLGTVESMKMEHPLRAPVAGVVERVAVAAGDRVALGAPLFALAPNEAPTPRRQP
ncbi:MAG TPA: biotin carboxylase N-terminal domain-containing protein [Acidimicrobiales bacterium]|nr:biotin carboxylase N-terminal domain-containing protein [Acidimicrobiales bacterium]